VNEGQSNRALQILNSNLTKINFHLESYLFLANYHFENKNYSKGLKVFHYMVKKLHTSKLIKSPKISNIEEDCEKVKKPSEEALEIYARVAQKYFELADSDVFSIKFSKTLTIRSLKYYNILNYYKFNIAETKYMLAVLHNRLEDFQISYDNLLDSKDFYLDGKESDSKDQIENINYMLGDNLIKSGHTDAGSLYLKSILTSPNASKSLKEYASSYLDSLSESFLSISVQVEKSYNNNINRVKNKNLALFDNFQSIFVSKDVWSEAISFNVFYNSEKHGHWSFFTSGDFETETMSNKGLADKDSRSYSSSFEIKYDNFKKSLLKLNLSWTYSLYKASSDVSFSKYSNLVSITPSYTYMFNRGSFTTKGSIAFTNSISGDALGEESLFITYQPFWKNRWISPSYSFEFANIQEESEAEISRKLYVNFSNLSSVSENHSFFFSLDATFNKNSKPRLAYKEFNAGLTHTYLTPWLNGLSLSLNVNYEYNIPRSNAIITVLEYGASIMYNF
jgi:hypothetical protein